MMVKGSTKAEQRSVMAAARSSGGQRVGHQPPTCDTMLARGPRGLRSIAESSATVCLEEEQPMSAACSCRRAGAASGGAAVSGGLNLSQRLDTRLCLSSNTLGPHRTVLCGRRRVSEPRARLSCRCAVSGPHGTPVFLRLDISGYGSAPAGSAGGTVTGLEQKAGYEWQRGTVQSAGELTG